MATRKRRTFTEEYKRDEVALIPDQGYSPSSAARSLNIGVNLIQKRRSRIEADWKSDAFSQSKRQEVKRFRKENRELKLEKEMFKKARAW